MCPLVVCELEALAKVPVTLGAGKGLLNHVHKQVLLEHGLLAKGLAALRAKGHSPVWMRLCWVRLECWRKLWLHLGQVKGRSPLWTCQSCSTDQRLKCSLHSM